MNPGEEDDFELDEAVTQGDEGEKEKDAVEGDEGEEAESPKDAPGELGEEADEIDPLPLAAEKAGKKTASDRVREQRNLAKAETERAQRLERELAELKAVDAERRRRDEVQSQQTRAERRLLMTDSERFADEISELREQQAQFQKQQQFAQAEGHDRIAFSELKAADPRVAKYETRVEKELESLRAKGIYNFGRTEILKFLIGEQVLAAKKQVAAQKTEGKAAIRRATTKPGNSGGDAGGRQRQGKSLEDRLSDVQL